MLRRFLAPAVIAVTAVLAGCASPQKMALGPDTPATVNPSKVLFLMTAKIANRNGVSHQPKLQVAHVERPEVKGSQDRLNYVMDDLGRIETNTMETGNTYLLRMEVDPGEYTLRGLTSISRSFPLVGFFFTPIHAQLKAAAPGVYYLGHVDATVRERKGEEFKAGPSVPLIDQALVGASTGTFDVAISDRWGQDENEFRARFPALKSIEVTKNILPPFDRQKAQAWWEAN